MEPQIGTEEHRYGHVRRNRHPAANPCPSESICGYTAPLELNSSVGNPVRVVTVDDDTALPGRGAPLFQSPLMPGRSHGKPLGFAAAQSAVATALCRPPENTQRHGHPKSGSSETTDDRIARMGTGFVMVENLFRGHPPGEPPFHRKPFFIRVTRNPWFQLLFLGSPAQARPQVGQMLLAPLRRHPHHPFALIPP